MTPQADTLASLILITPRLVGWCANIAPRGEKKGNGMINEKKLKKFTVNITDPAKFAGLRKEIIFGYAYALSDQLLTILLPNGGREHYNWSLVQSFGYEEVDEAQP
jgi:hypothetical protein